MDFYINMDGAAQSDFQQKMQLIEQDVSVSRAALPVALKSVLWSLSMSYRNRKAQQQGLGFETTPPYLLGVAYHVFF